MAILVGSWWQGIKHALGVQLRACLHLDPPAWDRGAFKTSQSASCGTPSLTKPNLWILLHSFINWGTGIQINVYGGHSHADHHIQEPTKSDYKTNSSSFFWWISSSNWSSVYRIPKGVMNSLVLSILSWHSKQQNSLQMLACCVLCFLSPLLFHQQFHFLHFKEETNLWLFPNSMFGLSKQS